MRNKRKPDVPVFNKVDLKREITHRLEKNGRYLYQKDINFIVDEVFKFMMEQVEQGNRVLIDRWGSLYTRTIRRYYGTEPQNGKVVTIVPEHKRITFSSGKTFKDRVNKDRNK